MGSPAQSRSRAAQSMFSPLSVTREREKTDEGEAQTETEAPERAQSKTFLLLDIKKTERGRRGPEPARGAQRRPDDKERFRGSPGAPEQVGEIEKGESQQVQSSPYGILLSP